MTKKDFEQFAHDNGLDPRYDGKNNTMHLYPKNVKAEEEYYRATKDAIEDIIFKLKKHFNIVYHQIN